MKKIVSCVALLLLSLIFLKEQVYAEEMKPQVTIEEQDIKNLVFDEAKEIFADKIIPPPMPSPVQKEEKSVDHRSWTKSEYKDLIKDTAKKYSVDAQVIYATIMTESEGNKYAFRYEPGIKDASLCMGQILINTAKSLGFKGEPKDLYKPEVCIDLIGKYHRRMLDDFGDLTPLQLATAYNAGSPWKRAVPGHLSRFQMWMEEEG